MAISIRLLQPQEAELANNFFNTIYGTARSHENFRWEFLEGPCGKAIYVVAVDDAVTANTKIVGIQCAIPLELISTKGQIVLTAKSEDTLVDPSYRGQKVFERMYDLLFKECEKAGIKYIWGFTPAQKAFERIGFEIPFSAQQTLLVLKPFQAYTYLKSLNKENKAIDKFKIFGLCLLSWIKQFKTFFGKNAALTNTSLEGKNDLFQKFYGDTPLFTLNETPAYVNWRIKKNPFHNKYESYQSANHDVDVILNFRGNIGYIEQILSKNDGAIKQLIPAMIRKFRSEKTGLVRTLSFSSNSTLTSQIDSLSAAGFTYLKRGNYFVWKSLTQERLIEPHQLFITRLFAQGNL